MLVSTISSTGGSLFPTFIAMMEFGGCGAFSGAVEHGIIICWEGKEMSVWCCIGKDDRSHCKARTV